MRSLIAALIAGLVWVGGVQAAEGPCAVAAPMVTADYPLPHVAAAYKARHIDIAVAGTGSSILAGPDGNNIAYPSRLQPALAKRLPGVEIKVTNYAKTRQTAAEMAQSFQSVLADPKPTLVVWQTGTVDAMKGIDPDDFRMALDDGVGALQSRGMDVILMNMQYSPRTESMIAIAAYADGMRWVGQHRQVPLFDRLAVMKQWSELGTFDLLAATKDVKTAAQVHDCIAQLVADLIVEGAKLGRAPKASQ